MHKKGFAFIESIIAIVFLTSSLLLLYGTFKRVIQNNKNRINYDEISYIYRSEYVKDMLSSNQNFNQILDNLNNSKGYIKIDLNLYNDDFYQNLINDFAVNEIVLIKKDKLKDFKTCLYSDSCEINITSDFKKYLKTINNDIDAEMMMAISYKECENDNCLNNYSWVGV